MTSLAAGSDQLVAEVALGLGIPIFSLIPTQGYEQLFRGRAKRRYLSLLELSDVAHLDQPVDDETAFLLAGQRLVDESDILFAIWDGNDADGKGGTADIVRYAKAAAKPVLHIDPLRELVRLRTQGGGRWTS